MITPITDFEMFASKADNDWLLRASQKYTPQWQIYIR